MFETTNRSWCSYHCYSIFLHPSHAATARHLGHAPDLRVRRQVCSRTASTINGGYMGG